MNSTGTPFLKINIVGTARILKRAGEFGVSGDIDLHNPQPPSKCLC